MTHVTTSRPAPAWLRELVDARAAYQERVGWPVSVQVGQRNLVVATGQELAAVEMPARLGSRVRAQLGISILSGPIVSNEDGTRWTFLAKPDRPVRDSVAEDLSAAQVRVLPPGTFVVVPTAMEPTSDAVLRWIEGPPRPNHALPPLHAVVGQARRLTYSQQVGSAAA
jgi:hypothetical protein